MNKLIFERPAKWNALRYKQVYNHELFSDMLFEEYTEFKDAKTTADKLDGLADLFFISVGALWKLKANSYDYICDSIDEYALLEELGDFHTGKELTLIVTKIIENTEANTLKRLITYLIEIIFKEFIYLNCREDQAELAILIVCDSNDTKKVGVIHESYKGDLKGNNYISPDKRLSLLAEVIE